MSFFQKKQQPEPGQQVPIIDQIAVDRYEVRMNGKLAHTGSDGEYALEIYFRCAELALCDRFQLFKNGCVIRQNFA